jgi:hypothetical protein
VRKALAEHAQADSQAADLRAALSRTLRALEKEKRSKADVVEAVYRAVADNIKALELKPVAKPVPDTRKRGAEVAVAMVGDWQLGKKTPTYDSATCEKRIEEYAAKIRILTAIQRADHPVRELRVWMLGDMVEGGGNIFPGQEWLVDSSLYRQVALDGPRIMGNFLRSMLAEFDTVHVTAIIGNHGRLGKWGQYDPESNSDRILYRITQQLLESEKRLTWNIPDGMGERHWYAVDRIGNYSCLLFHGDQLGGRLQGALTIIGAKRKISGWMSGAIREQFKDVAFGHWHSLVEIPIIGASIARCNGSPESDNTFAQEALAAVSEPSQRVMYVHPAKGIVTHEAKVWLS